MKISHLFIAASAVVGVSAVHMRVTEQVAHTSSAPSPLVHFEAEDYVNGSTSWTNRVSGGTHGTAPTGGMTKTSSGVSAVVFAGKESSNSDRIAGTIGSTTSMARVTVEMWVRLKDNGSSDNAYGSMLFSWSGSPHYNIYHYKNGVGFNTFSSELFGIDGSSFVDQWKHLTFVMVSGGTDADQKIYVDGVLHNATCNPSVTQLSSSCSYPSKRLFNTSGNFLLMDNGYSLNQWNAKADVAMVRIYGSELTASQVSAAYNASYTAAYGDTDGPIVSSAISPTSPSGSRTLTYTLNFNEAASGISGGDFTNTGTATGCTFSPSATSGTSVQVVVSCTSDGTVILKLNANSVTDAVANTGPANDWSASSVTIDSTIATTTTSTTPATTTTAPAISPTTSPIQQTPPTGSNTTPSSDINTSVTSGPQQTSATTLVPSRSTTPPTTTVRSPNLSTTTTTSTTITSTVPAMTSVTVPQVDEGQAVVVVDGRKVDTTVTRLNNQVRIVTPTFSVQVQVVTRGGETAALDPSGELAPDPGDSVRAVIEGLQPESSVEAQMHSSPVLLGRTVVGKDGRVSALYEIPLDPESGRHSFVLVGTDVEGQQFILGTGMFVESQGDTSMVMALLITIPLLGAVAAALFIPAVLRNRRRNLQI